MPNIGISALMASFVSSLVQTKVSTASPTRYALPFVKHARRRKTTTRLCRRIDDEEEVLVDVILKDRLDGGMLIVQKMRLHPNKWCHGVAETDSRRRGFFKGYNLG